MNTRVRTTEEKLDPWIGSPSSDDPPPEAGYHEALVAALAEGRAQLDAGQGIPSDEFWAKWDADHPEA